MRQLFGVHDYTEQVGKDYEWVFKGFYLGLDSFLCLYLKWKKNMKNVVFEGNWFSWIIKWLWIVWTFCELDIYWRYDFWIANLKCRGGGSSYKEEKDDLGDDVQDAHPWAAVL